MLMKSIIAGDNPAIALLYLPRTEMTYKISPARFVGIVDNALQVIDDNNPLQRAGERPVIILCALKQPKSSLLLKLRT